MKPANQKSSTSFPNLLLTLTVLALPRVAVGQAGHLGWNAYNDQRSGPGTHTSATAYSAFNTNWGGEGYAAVHELLNCRVAVKVLPPHLAEGADCDFLPPGATRPCFASPQP